MSLNEQPAVVSADDRHLEVLDDLVLAEVVGRDVEEVDRGVVVAVDRIGGIELAADARENDKVGRTDAPDDPEQADEVDQVDEHRPAADAGAITGCSNIVEENTGALIAFPSQDGPVWLDAGRSPVVVEFLGCSHTPEGSLGYRAFHREDGEPTIEGVTTGGALGASEWFGFEEAFWTPGSWTIEVFEVDADTGAERIHNEVTIAVE